MPKVPHDPSELIAIVDENNVVVGRGTRREVHAAQRIHRHASVLVVNRKGEILLQKRKDNGKLDYSASGHFGHDTSYLDAAVRETKEEIGLDIDSSRFVEVLKVRDTVLPQNDSFVCLFEVKGDYKIEDMAIDPLEVESIRYYSVNEVEDIVASNPKMGFFRILGLYLKKRA